MPRHFHTSRRGRHMPGGSSEVSQSRHVQSVGPGVRPAVQHRNGNRYDRPVSQKSRRAAAAEPTGGTVPTWPTSRTTSSPPALRPTPPETTPRCHGSASSHRGHGPASPAARAPAPGPTSRPPRRPRSPARWRFVAAAPCCPCAATMAARPDAPGSMVTSPEGRAADAVVSGAELTPNYYALVAALMDGPPI